MNKSHWIVFPFGIFFLLLIQLAGTLVESIYILDLLNTALDEKALGLLFFFSPILLLIFRKNIPSPVIWVTFGLLFLARGLSPYLDTSGRMLASGLGTGSALLLLPAVLAARAKGESSQHTSLWISVGLALGTAGSVLLRTIGYGLDYSLLPEGGWVGWGLGAALGVALTRLEWHAPTEEPASAALPALPLTGIFLVIALVYFAFSAPTVIARWTEGDYRWIVSAVSLLVLGWATISLFRPGWMQVISPNTLLAWNLAFSLALTATFLAHRVAFPLTPDTPAVVVGAPGWTRQIPLVLTLLLFPVVFLDMRILVDRVQSVRPAPRALAPGMLLGALTLVVLIFMAIFTNVWGYIEPVSPWFRNKFWLPFLLMSGLLALIVARVHALPVPEKSQSKAPFPWYWAMLLGALFLATAGSALYTTRVRTFQPPVESLLVMTYNIQQANDLFGERSYARQLELMQRLSPDLIALQESDSARVSLNNNDYVRYFAGKLGYYSYYGPKTVTGTYGTAIISKYPLMNTRSVFSYSDQDEVGTAEVELEIDGRTFTIYNVHPDGSDTAMLAFAETLLERSTNKEYVIALGDYNLRDYEPAYQRIAAAYTNAWENTYPNEISPDGTDMSGDNRIDHIFFSKPLHARSLVYVLPPDSATDHPVHWGEIVWNK